MLLPSVPPISTLRLLLRVANAFTLDLLTIYRLDRDFTDALILAALMQRRSAWLAAQPEGERRQATFDAPVADGDGGGVSINALAESLGLPFETTRRRVKRLLADGVCEPAKGGVRISASLLESHQHRLAIHMAYDAVRALYLRLRREGCMQVMGLPDGAPPLEGDPPVRIVWRAAADYFLRMMELLLPNLPGGLTQGFVLLEVIRANTAAMPDSQRGEDRVGGDAGVPDLFRRPVRTSDVARRLGLPHETARRSLAALVRSGRCQQLPEGFIVPGSALARPNIARAYAPNFQNLRRLFGHLAETGILARWDAEAGLNAANAHRALERPMRQFCAKQR